tara:strand:+ start:32 stop:790 length:759 start_codon:yes stop_codon:yes gene_type:complete
MSGKKRIALCLSGEARNSMFCFPYIYENFINLGDKFEIDVYIHTWKGFRALNLYNPIAIEKQIVNENLLFDPFLESFFPKINSDLLKQRINEGQDYTTYSNSIKNMFLMFYSIKKCFDLTHSYSSTPYDFYIRSRSDIFFKSPLYIKNILLDIEEKIYDMFIPYEIVSNRYLNQYCDQIAISNYKSMEIYSNIINNLDIPVNKQQTFNSQVLLKSWLDYNDIKVNQTYADFGIVRHSEVITNDENFNNFLSL